MASRRCLEDIADCRTSFLVFFVLCIAAVSVYVIQNNGYYTHIDKVKNTNFSCLVHERNNSSAENLLETSMKTTHSDQGMKYIVYDCSKSRDGLCGGWSDRISGILSAFTISLLTKQQFLINFDNPCPLQDYLLPTSFNWIYNSSLLRNKSSTYYNLIDHSSDKMKTYMSGSKDISTYFSHDVNFIRINWDFTNTFRKRRSVGSELPWITKLHYADIYKQLFYLLFKPSPVLVDALDQLYRSQRSRSRLACAHVRVGRNPNMPSDGKRPEAPLDILWKYFESLNKQEYDLFVASDSDNVKDLAKKRYTKNIIDTVGKITHIDRAGKNDPRQGFLKQLLDFYTMVQCDILVIPASGFSMLAAYIRDTDSGLYCWLGRDLRPCSRYTIHDTFPGEILAP